jgi:ubiquinone/menaquinone biosynthesis C-methylase UbiE
MDNQDWVNSKLHEWSHKKHTDEYEINMGWYARHVDAKVLAQYLESENGRVLDLPCGTGRFLKMLESEFKHFRSIGADYSIPMLTVANRSTDSPLIRCNGFYLPLQSQSFDVIICSRLVFHYNNPRELFIECYRVLVDGGVLIFDTLNYLSLRHILERPFNMIRLKKGKQLWFARYEQINTLLASCGFQIEKKISRYVLPTRAYRFIPKHLVRLLEVIEQALPESRRVLTYWKVRKI